MKATDFRLIDNLVFNPDKGVTSFKDSRLVIFDVNAIGLLRQNIIEKLGMEEARSFFLKFGYQHGYSDFLQMKINSRFESELELLASGPVIHSWEGIVNARPKEIRFDRARREFYFTGLWANSYEAEQHLSFNPVSKEPVCWSLMGYATGWCTAFFGELVLAVEPCCVGMGHDHCEWRIQPVDAWGDEAAGIKRAFSDLNARGQHGRKTASVL